MAPPEEVVVVDEFETDVVPVVADSAGSLTSALVFMTTFLLLAAIVIMMVAMKNWYGRGMFA